MSGEAGWRRWRAHGGIVELVSRRRKVVKAANPSDASTERWTIWPAWASIIVISIRVLLSFDMDHTKKAWLGWGISSRRRR